LKDRDAVALVVAVVVAEAVMATEMADQEDLVVADVVVDQVAQPVLVVLAAADVVVDLLAVVVEVVVAVGHYRRDQRLLINL
jgi:hypothetical protein